MVPGEFEYYAPTSVQEAVGLLREHGDEAKILAGGHSLVPIMKQRLAAPSVLIDLKGIAELRGITRSNGTVTIGAMTTQTMIEHSEELKSVLPILPAAAAHVADPPVRNVGTFGGSLAHADPAADMPAVVLALDAQMQLVGPNGPRTVPATEFFVDILTSALEPDEVLTHISIPAPHGRTAMSYQKFRHPASGYAVVGVAVVLSVSESGTCQEARIAITGATTTATRATQAEDMLRGKQLNQATIEVAAEQATAGMSYLGDIYASETYREHLVKVYTKRALLAAIAGETSGVDQSAQPSK